MVPRGIARKIDALGRVVIPAELRRDLGLEVGDLVEIWGEGDHLVLARVQRSCVFDGSTEELREFRGKLICADCASRLAAAES